jgi:hypothetical protein
MTDSLLLLQTPELNCCGLGYVCCLGVFNRFNQVLTFGVPNFQFNLKLAAGVLPLYLIKPSIPILIFFFCFRKKRVSDFDL